MSMTKMTMMMMMMMMMTIMTMTMIVIMTITITMSFSQTESDGTVGFASCNRLVYRHVQKISFLSLNATVPRKYQKHLLRTNVADGAKLEQTVVQISGAYTHPMAD